MAAIGHVDGDHVRTPTLHLLQRRLREEVGVGAADTGEWQTFERIEERPEIGLRLCRRGKDGVTVRREEAHPSTWGPPPDLSFRRGRALS